MDRTKQGASPPTLWTPKRVHSSCFSRVKRRNLSFTSTTLSMGLQVRAEQKCHARETLLKQPSHKIRPRLQPCAAQRSPPSQIRGAKSDTRRTQQKFKVATGATLRPVSALKLEFVRLAIRTGLGTHPGHSMVDFLLQQNLRSTPQNSTV